MNFYLFAALKRGALNIPSQWRLLIMSLLLFLGIGILFFAIIMTFNFKLVFDLGVAQKAGEISFYCVGAQCVDMMKSVWPLLSEHKLGIIVAIILGFFVSVWMTIGIVRIALSAYDRGPQAHAAELFYALKDVPRLFLIVLLNNFLFFLASYFIPLISIGVFPAMITESLGWQEVGVFGRIAFLMLSLAAVIGALFWVVRFSYFIWFTIDKKYGVIHSLKSSFQVTRGYSLQIFGVYLLLGLVGRILSWIPLINIIAPLVVALMQVYVYRALVRASMGDNRDEIPFQMSL